MTFIRDCREYAMIWDVGCCHSSLPPREVADAE